MSKYLVTGAQGFAGGYLIEHLAEAGHEVVPMARDDADLADYEAAADFIAGQHPDGIFHLAAPHTSVARSWAEPAQTMEGNLNTTLSVLEAARALSPSPRVIFTSSSEVYGEPTDTEDEITEETEPNPQSPYALSKLLGEKSCQFYFERFEVPVIIARAFNHIGPGQKSNLVFPSLARQIVEIETDEGEGEMRVGDLEVIRDFVDVRDMVEAYRLLMERGQAGEIYNAAPGRPRTVRSVLDMMIGMSSADIDVVVAPELFRPNNISVSRNDSTKLRDLGWQPDIGIEQTVAEVMEEARAKVPA